MTVFSPANLDKKRREKFPSFGDFFRALVTAAPKYDVKPAINHIHNIMNGKVKNPQSYLALFSDVLGCKIDDFFVTKREIA